MELKNANLLRDKIFINGKWQTAENKETISIINPSSQKLITTVPHCAAAETETAIIAAHAALPAWRARLAQERSDILLKWFQLIRDHRDDLAVILSSEQGKPLSEALGEVDYANEFIRWFAEECKRVYGDIIPFVKAAQRLFTIKQSIGVVAAIAPWNFPIAMITRKIAPALAAGCAVVVKPDSTTPLSALAVTYLAEQAGFPAGVINVLTGDAQKIGAHMCAHEKVAKLSFTGSTAVGRLLMQQCAPTIKKLSLELGGNAPFIVFDDANLDDAVAGAIACKFRNAGQTCVCANRLYVHANIYDAFAKKLTAAVQQLKIGDAFEKNVQIGPLINQKALDKVNKHITDAIEKGGKLITGGKLAAQGGLFFEPTVILNATQEMLIAKEETFGPVAALFKFNSDEEVIAAANDTIYGLAAYFYTQNIDRMWRIAEALEYGIVGVNEGIVSNAVTPFGGVKQSGVGREGSKYGIEDYLEIKYICLGGK